MTSVLPPGVVVREYFAPVTRHVRRVEIYESDGATRWIGDTKLRLLGGTVSVDYSRAERRSLDLELDNSDGGLVTGPGNFWYDKIIKVFRGVIVDEKSYQPKILVLGDQALAESPSGFGSLLLRNLLSSIGLTNVTINTTFTAYSSISEYDIIIGLGSATAAARTLLVQAYAAGKSVLIFGGDSTAWVPVVFSGATSVSYSDTTLVPVAGSSNFVTKGWTTFTVTPTVAWTTVSTSYSPIAKPDDNTGYSAISAFRNSSNDARAVAMSMVFNNSLIVQSQFKSFMASAMRWLNKYQPVSTWETQIGEFMIDRITDSSFPHTVKITGRDYTKKCLNSKFAYATQFATGLSLESIIGSIAGAAGISRRNLPATGIVVNRTFFYERGVARWDAIKEIADSYDYAIYFDPYGYLVMSKYNDPAKTSPTITIHPGADGQLVSWTKSTTDSRLYNHVIVTGDSSDATSVPASGEAINTNVNSPTAVAKIGDRLYQYSSSFIQTNAQALAVANSFLAVHSLEEFEISFQSLMLPWLEAGDIIGFTDSIEGVYNGGDPTIFLLSSLTIPLALGDMSGVGKRVTVVG